MKYDVAENALVAARSLPVRGAWIEITKDARGNAVTQKSLPVRGAWIEMISNGRWKPGGAVAPRAGSVD